MQPHIDRADVDAAQLGKLLCGIARQMMRLEKKGDVVEAHVNVRNTGNFAAKQVVQVYVSAPEGTPDRPARELKGYAKTRELAPSETQEVVIKFNVNDLAFWTGGEDGKWILPSGEWMVCAGTSSVDLPLKAALTL